MVIYFHCKCREVFLLSSIFFVGLLLNPLILPAAAPLTVAGEAPQDYRPLSQSEASASLVPGLDGQNISPSAQERRVVSAAALVHPVSVTSSLSVIPADSQPGSSGSVKSVITRSPFCPASSSTPVPAISFQGLDAEKTALGYFLYDALPTADLAGLTAIQAAPNLPADGYPAELGANGVITLYDPSASDPAYGAFYPLLAYSIAEAVGENVYQNVMTAQERKEWASLIPGPDPQQAFGVAYERWVIDSSSLFQQALPQTSSTTMSLAQTLFVASFFINTQSQIKEYVPEGMEGNFAESWPDDNTMKEMLAGGTGTLNIGNYLFEIQNNEIVSWANASARIRFPTYNVLNPPVAVPETWQSNFNAAPGPCLISPPGRRPL